MWKWYNIGVVLFLALAATVGMGLGHKVHPLAKPLHGKKIIQAVPVFCAAFDTTQVVVTPADCNTSNGSIIGLQGSGTGVLTYSWYNSIGIKIGDQNILTNVPVGTYRVTLTDESKCPAITLTYFVRENNPVSIDTTSGTITSATCNGLDGSITGIIVHNATKFQWLDVNNGGVVPGAITKDLLHVGPGTYLLNATNANGCLAQARYTIDGGDFAPKLVSFETGDSDCAATGFFHATFDIKPNELGYQYAIVNVNTNKTVASGGLSYSDAGPATIIFPATPDFPGLPGGTYVLSTIGAKNCITQLVKFTIKVAELKIDTSEMLIKTDVCGQDLGVILGLKITGGPPPLHSDDDPEHGWFWFNSDGARVPSIGSILAGRPSGWYTVYAENSDGCRTKTIRLFLPDSIAASSKPLLNDVKMCLPGIAALDVLNKDPKAHYRLYDSTQQTILDTSTAGYFARKINVTTVFYLQSVNGICASPLGKVTATVVNPGVSIPNAFTPNNDGINDYWDIIGLGNYPGTEVSVFNRNGQRVYHTINYSTPFNGQYNGKDLPVGTYYFIVDTKKPDCRGGISGSLTIIR